MYMLNEHDTLSARSERLEMAGQKLSGAYSLWEYWSHDEKKTTLMEFLKVKFFTNIIIDLCLVFGSSWSFGFAWCEEDSW